MILNIAVILVALAVAYWGVANGFFSALMHLACTIAAGAIALAFWEPVAMLIMEQTQAEWINDMVWGASLGLTFAVSLAALLGLTIVALRANMKLNAVANGIGGAVAGAGSGTIVAGMLLLTIGNIRGTSALFGHERTVYDNAGSIVRGSNLWFPADDLTTAFYSLVSRGTLSTDTPLARYYPHLAEAGSLLRKSFDEEKPLRHTLRKGDVELLGRYTVGASEAIAFDALMGQAGTTAKPVLDLNGEPLKSQNGGQFYLEGFVLKFNAGSREKFGQVVWWNGAATLVVESYDGLETRAIMPIAMISNADGESSQMGRWTFDSKGVFIASPGASADPLAAFEFPVPRTAAGQAWRAVALYVRGIRFDLLDYSTEPPSEPVKVGRAFASVTDRNSAIASSAIMSVGGVGAAANATGGGTLNTSKAQRIRVEGTSETVMISNRLPMAVMLRAGSLGGLEVDDKNKIRDGEAKFKPEQMLQRGTDRSLVVDSFLSLSDVGIIQVDVSPRTVLDMTGPDARDATGAPVLVDANGSRYQCVGFVYKDNSIVHVRFTPGRPINSMNDLPSVSSSRADQKITLVFRVSMNVDIKHYAIGDTALAEFAPVLKLTEVQR